MGEVSYSQLLLLTLFDKVLKIELDSVFHWMSVIEHCLIIVVSKIHSSRVPSRVFKVNKDHMSGVRERSKNVVFLCIIVSQYYL